jgi:hypothetical protein
MSIKQDHSRFTQSIRGIMPRRRFRRVAAILLLIILAQLTPLNPTLLPGSTSVAHAANTLNVAPGGSDTGNCQASACHTIGYAIGQAGSGDTISIAAGTYSERLIIGINLTLMGAGAGSTIIDGANGGTVITVNGGATVSLSGLTIQKGTSSYGGGINNSAGSLALNNVVVTSNTATVNGAGMYTGAGTVTTISNSSIKGNTIDSSSVRAVSGGGIYNQGSLIIDRSIIDSNLAKTELSSHNTLGNGASANGGGIDNLGTLTVTSSSVINNTAAYPDAAAPSACPGGGGSLPAGDCFGTAAGGGIANESAGMLTLTNSTVSGNNVTTYDGNGLGGGILNAGTVGLTNSTIGANSVAVYVGPAGALSYAYGGGLAVENSASLVSLQATILANNTLSPGNNAGNPLSGPDCSTNFASAGTSVNSQGYNLIRDTSNCSIGGNTTGNIAGQDPLLGPLQNNGGPTLTQLPGSGSPAIGAVATGCPSTDQRGFARPATHCTIGAVEVQVAPPAPSLTLAETHSNANPPTPPVNTTILGQLNTGVASHQYTLNFYSSASRCPTSSTPGTLIGSAPVSTDASGTVVF